jgi:hypothetical protein
MYGIVHKTSGTTESRQSLPARTTKLRLEARAYVRQRTDELASQSGLFLQLAP